VINAIKESLELGGNAKLALILIFATPADN